MSKLNVEGVQNAEVSKKIPCEKPIMTQLEIMEEYTNVHKSHKSSPKEIREIACLNVLYPALFRQVQDDDQIMGRTDFLPIGFGCVTSVGGVGHYCVFAKLKELQKQLPEEDKKRVDALYDYWLENDLKTIYCRDVVTDTTVGQFINCDYPMIATARLSGMMLDYHKLMDLGINGIREQINGYLKNDPGNQFYIASLLSLDLFEKCADFLKEMAEKKALEVPQRKEQFLRIANSLQKVKTQKPETFHEAIQLFWLYALLAGVINYGRMDDVLGSYLANDIKQGRITENESYDILKSLWGLIENRRTTVNGRIIVGGRGRRNPEDADVFLRIAMRVAADCRYVEPQFTLRFDESLPEDIWDMAMDILGAGATYPTLYNDDVNIPAVQYGMRVDEKAAEQYVPFGCAEFVLQGQSVGTPNVCLNLLKLLNITLNQGIDPMDGLDKSGGIYIPPVEDFKTFDDLYSKYKELLDYYFDLSIDAQMHSYKVMNDQVSFLFTSILMDDCIAKGKALLDGGVRYLGGTNETYGNINTSDSLYAIKTLVYDKRKYTLKQLQEAVLADFKGYEDIRLRLRNCDKYGNDLDSADSISVDLYEYVAKGIRQRGIEAGMQYYLIVISNNQMNTEWGRRTSASYDGRHSGKFMNPANNPQGGADLNGPTAMLNSLVKLSPKYHGGSVQNIKFTPDMFSKKRGTINSLFKTYFKRGGCQLMVTVIDKGILEDAVIHPENYPNLLVRVSGFSAVFINLATDIQEEIMSRMLYDIK